MLSMHEMMAELAKARPVFHSEADFQHALAWVIHESHPRLRIRLERKAPALRDREAVDIWVERRRRVLVLELKYKTAELVTTARGEEFNLKSQSAQDCGRYDFVKDIGRLERITEHNPNARGCAILLTNDHLYWKLPRTAHTMDAAFRLHGGRVLQGHLTWRADAAPGTTRGRTSPIRLRGEYELAWQDYSTIRGEGNREFRYLLVEV